MHPSYYILMYFKFISIEESLLIGDNRTDEPRLKDEFYSVRSNEKAIVSIKPINVVELTKIILEYEHILLLSLHFGQIPNNLEVLSNRKSLQWVGNLHSH